MGVTVDVETTPDVALLANDALAEDVSGVLVDVTTMGEVDCEEGETVVTEVLALDESADEESEVEDEPPVLNATLWRLAIAIAMSRSLAETDESVQRARRRVKTSERMVVGGFVSSPKVEEKVLERGCTGEMTPKSPAKRA